MKVNVYSEEIYPVYEVVIHGTENYEYRRPTCQIDISEEFYARCLKNRKDFDEIQSEIEKLLD